MIQSKKYRRKKINPGKKSLNVNILYKHLLDTLGIINTGFIVIDSISMEVLFVNDAFSKMCTYEVDELYEMPSLLSIINKKSSDQFKQQFEKLHPVNNTVKVFNSILTRKDNKKINLEFSARQLKMNDKTIIIMIVRDITKVLSKNLMNGLIHETLLESEGRYRSMIENVKDYAIFMIDYSGRVISWNSGAKRILGYDENEIILKKFELFFSPKSENIPDPDSILKKAIKEGHTEFEMLIEKKDGKKIWSSVTLTRLDDHDSETGILSIIIHDLAKNKAAEEQLHEKEIQLRSLAKHLQDAREEERLRIARELHDEFSQMLTVLRMDLSVLNHTISKTVTEPLKRISLLEKISSISELLERTIRSTRRIITELRPAVLDELGLYTAIQWQAQEFENRTGIRCKITKLQHDINFDRNTSTAIFRILQEGLTNVAKHSGATTVIISLKVNNGELLMEVKDNGKGIDEKKLRAPTSTGLLGIRERVMAFNGNFEIHSERDEGTRLRISVPYKQV